MIKEELPDSRRFQLMRLRIYIAIQDDFIKQIQLIPQWDRENVRQVPTDEIAYLHCDTGRLHQTDSTYSSVGQRKCSSINSSFGSVN
nr:MAG TPA: hypothetical protein [Caudoviricetes sp.]